MRNTVRLFHLLIIKLLIITLLFANIQNAVAEELLWLTHSSFFNPNEKYTENIGLMGTTMTMILDELPEYKTQVLFASVNSAFNLLKSKKNACTGNKALSEKRSQFSYATKFPQTISPGLRLYLKTNSTFLEKIKSLVNDKQQLSVQRILEQIKTSKFGVVDGRLYGEQLDKLITDKQWQRRFWSRSSEDMASGLIDMLFSDRLDFIFEYPAIFTRYHPVSTVNNQFTSFAIEESSSFVLGYVLCSKTKEGQLLVNKIDKAIEKISKNNAYFDSHLSWVGESAQEDMTRYYNQVYDTNMLTHKDVISQLNNSALSNKQ